MEPRTLVCNLLISVLVLVCIKKCYLQNISSSAVIFPDANHTEHSLPVFPDVIAQYVGQKRRIAPAIDEYGRPRCLRNTGDTFCEQVEDYPDDLIRRYIPYTPRNFTELFGAPEPDVMYRKLPAPSHSDLTEETICPQRSRMFYPKAAVNENDEWAFVINDVDYVQAVMAEICDFEDGPCKLLDGILPFDTSSRCRQKYAYKKLLALHPNRKKTYTDAFRFPSCCVCYIRNHHILSRTRMADTEESSTMSRDFIPNSSGTNLNVTDSNWTTRSNHTSIFGGSAANSEKSAPGLNRSISRSDRTATDISRSVQSSNRRASGSYRNTTASNRNSGDRTVTETNQSIRNSDRSASSTYRSAFDTNRNVPGSDQPTNCANST